MTNRWKIILPKSECLIYAETKERAEKLFPEALDIVLYQDNSYLDKIDKIKSVSTLMGYDRQNHEVYKFPYNGSFILVILHKDKNGDYYDILDFQRWDCRGLINPITWSLCNAAEFFEMFAEEYSDNTQGFIISPKELKKLKPQKFYNKDGETMWIDSNGCIYIVEKWLMPNKKNKAEYEQFKNNPNAVWIKFINGLHSTDYSYRWFDNIDAFKDFFQELHKDRSPAYATPTYEILKHGYKKANPDDRKVILKLPYMNIHKELRMGTPIPNIANCWAKMCHHSWQGRDLCIYDYLIEVISHYAEWLKTVKD